MWKILSSLVTRKCLECDQPATHKFMWVLNVSLSRGIRIPQMAYVCLVHGGIFWTKNKTIASSLSFHVERLTKWGVFWEKLRRIQ